MSRRTHDERGHEVAQFPDDCSTCKSQRSRIQIRGALLALIRAPERTTGYEASFRAEGYAEGYNDAVLRITRAITGDHRINADTARNGDDWWTKL